MNIKDIILPQDFLNLTKHEIQEIIELLGIDISGQSDIKSYLYSMKNLIFNNEETNKLLLNKVFAGQTSVKWYIFDYLEDEESNNKDKVIEKLESEDCCFSRRISVNIESLNEPKMYTCIKAKEDIYVSRFLVPVGFKTINDGESSHKIKNISNVIAIIDLNKRIIEVRASSEIAKKILGQFKNLLPIANIDGIRILKNYHSSIEAFRDSLINGQFIQSTCAPDDNLELTEENNELLANMLLIIDEYFINQNLDNLVDSIKNLTIDTDGTPFTQLLLAGMAKIGISIRKDAEGDLSQQSLYNILKKHITDYSSFIRFSNTTDAETYTMLLGLTTNTVVFKSSVDEKVIEYIREKVI